MQACLIQLICNRWATEVTEQQLRVEKVASVILLESFWLVQGFPFLGNGQSEFPEVQRDGTKSRLLST